MVRIRYGTVCLINLGLLLGTSAARRQSNQRRDASDAAPVISAGWTVPLEGAETCTSNHCTDTLTGPPSTSDLQYLAIGRGTITYTCDSRSSTEAPIYVTQQAFLYDAGPLVYKFSSEQQFHSYLPRFLDFDYTSLDNSTLNCIGDLQRMNGSTIFDLYNLDAAQVKVKEVVDSPNDRQFDIQWAHSQDSDQEWDIYRVETAGGGPPYDCGDQIISDEIPVEYAAEYWFFRTSMMGQQAQEV